MPFGAGLLGAEDSGAEEIVDPRPFAIGPFTAAGRAPTLSPR